MKKSIPTYSIHGVLVALCVLAFATFSTQLEAENKLVINTGNHEPYISGNGGGFYGRITKEVFRRLGIEADLISVPSQRSLVNANAGIDDGNMARIKGIEKRFPNLVRVPEKIIDFEFVVYSAGPVFDVTGWESLRPYEIGFINGWLILERNVTSTKKIIKLKSPRQLFDMVKKKRIDLIIYERWGGLWWIKELNSGAKLLQPNIAKRELFLYLHKKHAYLVPDAAQALVDMKKDGAYQRIFNETLSVLNKYK
ncbi:MAG: transporter substrate-binding domain-containing protein [Gammaproteobacteria bacterium]|nr:MAG: transporter substrate-binding domain-containing protein [Gammaproteobacteria bacterium]